MHVVPTTPFTADGRNTGKVEVTISQSKAIFIWVFGKRISLGGGYEPGESQSGLIINQQYKGLKLGREAIYLAMALAKIYFDRQYSVEGALVNGFTVTILDSKQWLINQITAMGLKTCHRLQRRFTYSLWCRREC